MRRNGRPEFPDPLPLRQYHLQVVLTSAVSLACIIGPLAFSAFNLVIQKEWSHLALGSCRLCVVSYLTFFFACRLWANQWQEDVVDELRNDGAGNRF